MARSHYTPGPLYRPVTVIHSFEWGGGGGISSYSLQMARVGGGVTAEQPLP